MSDVIDYEEAVADYSDRLLTQLRGHGARAEYLEMWVPDDDPVKSVLNMVEAAAAYGRGSIAVTLRTTTLDEGQLVALTGLLTPIGEVGVSRQPAAIQLTVTGLAP